ncbi:hypothetical protein JCGZ_06837 [Jatropha curcas]|uniref:Uncharacterized protein n=1 Tax=Jatropha curcas TaxID=180498 RepID=A0A067JC91_JATCU|nr:hypothetical protein JCGZ_06837 [Jatropha curcas]
MGCFVTRIARYLVVWNLARPIYDSVGGGRGTRLDLDVMIHMKLIEKVGDSYRIAGAPEVDSDDAGAEAADGTNMEEDNPPPFTSSFGAGTSGAGPSFQDRFQSIKIMNDSLDSRIDTMQGQLQTILQLLQPPPPPEN